MGFGVSQGILVGIIEQYQDELSAQLSSQFTGKQFNLCLSSLKPG